VRRQVPFVVLVSLAAGAGRSVWACPPAVRLGGDKALVAEVAPVLSERGISTAPGECPALAIVLDKRGRATLVTAAGDDGGATREVTDVRTAATVIESWVRTDVEAPLLARRRADDDAGGGAPPTVVVDAPAPDATGGLQAFALGESGLANDRTSSVGLQVGACAMRGPACVGGRARVATVADGPGEWEATMDREAVDALASLDLPVRLGRMVASSGVGLGLGWVHTHEEASTQRRHTLGLRAESRLTLGYSVSARLAFEATLAFELARTVAARTTTEVLPADPSVLGRLGVGVRFGGP